MIFVFVSRRSDYRKTAVSMLTLDIRVGRSCKRIITIPFKRRKKQELTQEQKRHNRELASFRVRVEHKIRQIKTFKIMSESYRKFQKKYALRMNIIAGLVNLKYAAS